MQPVVPEFSRRRDPKLGMTARATPIVSSASTVTVASRSRQSRTSRSRRKWLMGTSSEAIASAELASFRSRASCSVPTQSLLATRRLRPSSSPLSWSTAIAQSATMPVSTSAPL